MADLNAAGPETALESDRSVYLFPVIQGVYNSMTNSSIGMTTFGAKT